MSSRATEFTLRHFLEHPALEQFRKVHFPIWFYRESNPELPHAEPTA